MENEDMKSMILQLQQTEGDDDQARDEFFENMMQSARVLFMTEERDLLPTRRSLLRREKIGL